MKIELSDEDRRYIITAIDVYVRQTGIANAARGLVVLQAIQAQDTKPDADGADEAGA